jgi:hypothetical protein
MTSLGLLKSLRQFNHRLRECQLLSPPQDSISTQPFGKYLQTQLVAAGYLTQLSFSVLEFAYDFSTIAQPKGRGQSLLFPKLQKILNAVFHVSVKHLD